MSGLAVAKKHIGNSIDELYNSIMEIVADASAFLAVVLNEADRDWVIEKTSGYTIVSPEVLPYEIGNALIAVRRKGRLTDREVLFKIYAYGAFYVQCCIETKLPLVSLDRRMCDVARDLGIKVVM